MLKKAVVVLGALGLCALSLISLSCANSSNRPAGLLYVVSQSQLNVSSFSVNLGNGSLSLINPNLVGTCPQSMTCGLPLGISVDPSGDTAFVLNQQALSSYNVGSDGSLVIEATPAYTFPTGQTAVAMTPTAAGDFLFVITVGAPNPTDCPAPDGSYGSDCPIIWVFNTNPGSTTVTLANSYPLSRIPTALSVLTYTIAPNPTQTMLFVTSNYDLTSYHNDSELSVFTVDSSGNLTEQSSSPYTTQVDPLAVKAVNTNPAAQNTGGVFVYVGSQGAVSGSVSAFEVCTQAVSAPCTGVTLGNLVAIGTAMNTGQNPIAMLADPSNTFLYVACNVGNNVYGFTMTTATGILVSLSPALQPTGTGPVALAMHPSSNVSNEYLYVANNAGSTISGYTVNVTTGSLSSPMSPIIFPPGNPYGMAAR